MHMTALRDEQPRHYCAIEAPVRSDRSFVQCKALFNKCISRRRRCKFRDKIRLKLIETWYSTFEDVES